MDAKNETGVRVLLIAAGLIGISGVMAAAAASHAGESRNLAAIAAICLSHGPALLALGLLGQGRVLQSAGWLLAGGTLVFAADLGVRDGLGMACSPAQRPWAVWR